MTKALPALLAFALCNALVSPRNVRAQGTAFTYQGRLSVGTNAANGIYDLRFTIYDASSSGEAQGSPLTNAATDVSNGQFTVTLNFGAGVFNGTNRWLEIGVRTNGIGEFVALTPRQPVTPTPYAIYAGGANASGLDGTIGGSQIAPGAIGTIHLSNTVILWNRSGTNIYYADGNVGIGTGTPSGPLSVSTLNGTVSIADDEFAPALVMSGGPGAGILRVRNALEIWPDTNGATAGNLDLRGTNGTATIVLSGASGTVTATGFIGDGSGLTSINAASLAGALADAQLSANVARRDVGNEMSGNQTIHSGSVNVPNGQVSVGGALLVGGNQTVSGTITANSITANNTVTATSFLGSGSGLTGVPKLTSGDIGVDDGAQNNGTTSFGLRFGGVGSAQFIGSKRTVGGSRFGLDFYTAGTSRVSIGNNGRVGIGTAIPSEKLDVEGNIALPKGNWIDTGRGATRANLDNGKIGYQVFSQGLDIVGAGTTVANRAITMHGNVSVSDEVTCTAVNITSDRDAKERFKPVNVRAVFEKIATLPISEWQYKTQADARHIGPMAQDFHEAFALGRDEKHITSVDADGVALAAIQGLNEKLEERLRDKGRQIEELSQTVEELKNLVHQLAARQNGGAK